jgi:predicted metallopeptidase
MPGAPLIFSEAEPVEELAQGLIGAHHPHLNGARIRYIFRSKHKKSNMREVWGTASLATGRMEYFAQADFIIEVAQDIWHSISEKQRLALVDHELCHCVESRSKGPNLWAIRGHDVEEFEEIIRRHGPWKSDLFHFSLAVLEDAAERIGACGTCS